MAVDPARVASGDQGVAAGEPQEASSQPQEQAGGGIRDWLRSTFFGGGDRDQQETDAADASEGGRERDPGRPATTADERTDGPITYASRAERDQEVARLAQSMKDRELAAERRRSETVAQRAERLRLAREEPYKLADQVEQELTAQEQAESYQAQFVQSLTPVLQLVDAEVVGQVVQALPDAARQRLFAEMPADLAGLAQRRHIVTAGLEALRAHWTAEGRATAQGGQIHAKAYAAGQRAAEEEPDLVPAAGVPHRTDMDAILRAGFGVP